MTVCSSRGRFRAIGLLCLGASLSAMVIGTAQAQTAAAPAAAPQAAADADSNVIVVSGLRASLSRSIAFVLNTSTARAISPISLRRPRAGTAV
ncbi:hypothetical protein ACI394_27915, partial [Klebsiella pneumoniae]|uniref:hypothetical protein n=1 Tax=Klebsiella pneumoniae TaxID=573 RepID=UPI003854A88C